MLILAAALFFYGETTEQGIARNISALHCTSWLDHRGRLGEVEEFCRGSVLEN